MHNNYYFLRQLVPRIELELMGKQLLTCFSQNKDELILGFSNQGHDEFYIKADLTSQFACLSFSNSFARAKRNSVDLFSELIGQSVLGVDQFLNERAFSLRFSKGARLVFKMFGNQSNVLVYPTAEGVPSAVFRGRVKQDVNREFVSFNRSLNQEKDDFENNPDGIKNVFPTFGDLPRAYRDLSNWEGVNEILEKFSAPKYYLIEHNEKLRLSLLDVGNVIKVFSDPLDAVNEFYYQRSGKYYFSKEKKRLQSEIGKQLKQTRNYLNGLRLRLDLIEKGQSLEEIGHIIMANLHLIPEGVNQVDLLNFYSNDTIKIDLKPRLSPQKNAERYYRKSKNQKIEIDVIKDNLKQALSKIEAWETELDQLEEVLDFKSLKALRFYSKDGKADKPAQAEERFKTLEFQGFRIYIGRNSKNNDELTQREAFKDDLWLHAKDVSGSHVVIKYQAGKKFPKSVIERAAEVAAYHSKRKKDSLCPVIFTPKKYVRKVKGAPAGAVIVEREEVIMVSPRDIR